METLKFKIAQVITYVLLIGVLVAIVAFAFRNGVSDLA